MASTGVGRFGPGLALVTGALYALSLPPAGLWPLAWVALAPLCVACVGTSIRSAALLGGVAGAAAAIGTSPWLPAMLADYFQASPVAVWPIAITVWATYGALYFAVFGAWLAWASQRGPVSPWLVAAAWMSLEWARANAAIPNPWALLGYSQMGWLPLAQGADLMGPFGIGALLAASSACVAAVFAPAMRCSGLAHSAAGVAMVAALTMGYGLARTSLLAASPDDASLRVGVVQGAVDRDRRYERAQLAETLALHLELTADAVAQGAELVVWPELALDFYVEHEPALLARLTHALGQLDTHVIAGGLGATGTRPANAVFSIAAEGIVDRADKVRLMAFSESRPIPFVPIGSDRIVPGAAPHLLEYASVAFGVAICSEAMHPGYVRRVVRDGGEVILAPSMDGWFGARGAMRQQLGAVAMRAIETRRFVVRPTPGGLTAIIDPTGRVVAEAPADEPAARVADVVPRRGRTVYVSIGDAAVAIAVLAVGADAVARRRRAQVRSA